MWENVDKTRPEAAHYSVMCLIHSSDGMNALRSMFPLAKADCLNFVLFSTSGVHGTYNTIEETEQQLANGEDDIFSVTFLIVHPRLVSLRYGTCLPESQEDIDYLKRLRKSSHEIVMGIGGA